MFFVLYCFNATILDMKKLSRADRAEILRRLHAGEKQQDVADAFDVSRSTIVRVSNEAKKAQREIIEDPNPAITTETLQKQYWAKQHRYEEVIETRRQLLETDKRSLNEQMLRWENQAKSAPTTKIEEANKQIAEGYRLKLASLNDLTELDAEILEMLTDLKTRAEVLVKVRKAGLGKPTVEKSKR